MSGMNKEKEIEPLMGSVSKEDKDACVEAFAAALMGKGDNAPEVKFL